MVFINRIFRIILASFGQLAFVGLALAQAETVPGEIAPKDSLGSEETTTASSSSSSSQNIIAVHPEGQVLPKGVVRARAVHRHYSGTFGFDSEGRRQNMGLRRNTAVTAVVGEYGITEKLSFRLMAPIIYRNQLNLDQEAFRKSAIYKQKYDEIANKIAQKFADKGLCSLENCRAIMDKGDLPFPSDQVLPLPTGEKLKFTADRSIKNQIDEFLLAAATPELEGPTGLGDVEGGLLYNFHTASDMLFSTGLGLRAPTGDFSVTKMQRPTSGGVYDVGFRLNFDYSPVYGLWFSVQEQVEHAISKAKWQRASLTNPNKFNLADPRDGGDGEPNTRTWSKAGFSYDTLMKAHYGLGAMNPLFKAFAVNTSYNFRQERAIYLDNKQYTPSAQLHSLGLGTTISGLAYKIPVELEVGGMIPIAGRNTELASEQTEAQLKIYARF